MSDPSSASQPNEVKVQVHEKGSCLVEMEVNVSPRMIQEARKNAIKAVNKEVELPGFRRGKAPQEIIVKKFPADIEERLRKELADLAFLAAQQIAHVPVLNNNSQISFHLQKLSPEEGADLLFSFETEPKVPPVDLAGFSLEPIEYKEASEEQIQEAILQMRFFYAQWKPVEDRPVQDGDYITINLDTVEGDVLQNVFRHVRFEVSKTRMASWMKKLVEGAKAGDLLEGISEADETATEEEKAQFKPKKVLIYLLEVQEVGLPELNDDFAKKVGSSDLADMRQSVANLLNSKIKEKIENEQREQVNKYLVDHYHFELPQSLVNTELKHRFSKLSESPDFKSKWNKISEDERKEVEMKLLLETSQALRLFYLSRSVVRDEKIPLTHQEVQHEALRTYESQSNRDVDPLSKEIYALAFSKVLLAKVQDLFLKKT